MWDQSESFPEIFFPTLDMGIKVGWKTENLDWRVLTAFCPCEKVYLQLLKMKPKCHIKQKFRRH